MKKTCNSMLSVLSLAFLSLSFLTPVNAVADYTVVIDKVDNRGAWEGWGTSLSWWAKGVGKSNYENLHADLLFSTKNVEVMPNVVLPGLGLNIARYNPGGGGLPTDNIDGAIDKKPPIADWYKDIDGYWVNWYDYNPQSKSWDWSRDENQRSMMEAARLRGASFEFFFNAPMWWMTYEKSSAGGAIQPWNEKDYAYYVANVVNYAKKNWNIDVKSVEPLNEPSAGWWKFPNITQEGLNLSLSQQVTLLKELRTQLNTLGLNSVQISAADENTMTEAIAGYQYFQNNGASSIVDRINVHAYNGLEPWRDNTARTTLKNLVGNKPIRISEYGDNDADGMTLAHTIIQDINYLKPSSWVYWQAIEPYSSWGLINSNYYDPKTEFDVNRGIPYKINNKYYLFSQFTRYLRPNDIVIGSNDKNTIVAFDSAKKQLKFITVNFGNPQKITYDLNNLQINSGNVSSAKVTFSTVSGLQKAVDTPAFIINGMVDINAEANAVYSVVIDNVDLFSSLTNKNPVVLLKQPITKNVSNTEGYIEASATDSDGSIAKVEFYYGDKLLNTVSKAPYILNWAGVADGTYPLTAKAYDDKGSVTISNAITVVINSNAVDKNQRPTVSLSQPVATTNNTGYIEATAQDSDGFIAKVEFYYGNTLLSTVYTAPYRANWTNAPAGTYNITAKAYDNVGAVMTSQVVPVVVK